MNNDLENLTLKISDILTNGMTLTLLEGKATDVAMSIVCDPTLYTERASVEKRVEVWRKIEDRIDVITNLLGTRTSPWKFC